MERLVTLYWPGGPATMVFVEISSSQGYLGEFSLCIRGCFPYTGQSKAVIRAGAGNFASRIRGEFAK